jgi:hypothetical protein
VLGEHPRSNVLYPQIWVAQPRLQRPVDLLGVPYPLGGCPADLQGVPAV